jgi:hypothetical protein
MLKGWLRRWRPPAVDSAAALSEFLDRSATQVAQSSIIGYCHVKTSLPLHELIREKPFADAFEVARWEAFAAILADLVLVAEGYLRPAAAGRLPNMAERLTAMYRRILDGHPVPAHRPAGWQAEITAMRQRLAAAQQTLPRSISQIAEVSAGRVFDTLPIHERLRAPDRPAIEANVQFLMVGLAHQFETRLDTAALVADLLAPPAMH